MPCSDAMYDDSRGRKRCVYTTLSEYSMKGTKEAIETFPGCGETPSKEHSAGLDDGTASKEVYDKLTASGTYRVAAIKEETKVIPGSEAYQGRAKAHCETDSSYITDKIREKHRMPYTIYNHFGKMEFSSRMTSPWEDKYPKDECTDFPSGVKSDTLAIRNTRIIDVPTPVPFPALCSIETNVDCGLKKRETKTICRTDQICQDVSSWNKDTNLYATCRCAKFHEENNGKCEWATTFYGNAQSSSACAKIHMYECSTDHPCTENEGWIDVEPGNDQNIYYAQGSGYSDNTDRAVVKIGCKLTVWSHPPHTATSQNYRLLNQTTYGEYVVPHHKTGTLNGWDYGMSASGLDCKC